jgi:hypothetical protein
LNLEDLTFAWKEAKEKEQEAVVARRIIEDKILSLSGIGESETGVKTFGSLKITCRHNQSVDSDLLQQIAAENDMVEQASQLFRWKAEVNKKLWDATAPDVVDVFLPAITVKPGRPSFSFKESKE